MPEKDWEKVKALFHDALRRDTSERGLFLDKACEGDINLRIEVESLLMSLTEAKSFLELPVIGEPAEPKAEWHLENGRQISHYTIVEPIGSGGMSEVYLADDLKLGRKVALKVLPREMLNDRSRLRRFEREANAVSALNHPNILTIFEFEQDSGIHFFASEFVQGVTLRKRLDSGKLSVIETLEISSQIASALQAAHNANVVHRDIKPENVMIRDDGYVKVLDFGLAKLTEKVTSGNAERTLTQLFSLPGMIMGTVTYMSPEQARGSRVDSRSDIFSLGIVLFEMLTGRPPFCGETATDVLAEIIQTVPPPPSSLNAAVPKELDDVVGKALEKAPADRFQTAAELVSELKAILKRLEFNAELRRSPDANPDNGPAGSIPEDHRAVVKAQTSFREGLSPLVGRENEIAELTRLLISDGSRLVTLTGTGGTGKTRLAQEMCARLGSHFRDGYVFVRLGEVHDPTRIPMVIARQAGVQEIVGTPIAASLMSFLESRHLLMVLDNFEQIMDAAPFVAEMLSAAEKLSVLVTTRERLNISAETEFNVPPLPVPVIDEAIDLAELGRFDSVRLFVERARQADPDFQLSENNAAQVAKICSMLDGLPLAIELAAARARIFSPATILEKLEGRLAFLTGGARDLPERQQTMRAAVEWSYDLLNDDEKRLFRRLSVFASQFTASAAETIAWDKTHAESVGVITDSVEFLDVFASLADKSLLIRRKHSGGETKYGLLDVVREYAEGILATDDDEDEIRLRHARFYLALAEKAEPHLQTRESGVWLRRLEEDHDNLRIALRWSLKKAPQIAARLAAAIRKFWLIRGHLSEGLLWSQRILDQNIELLPAIKWKLLSTCGNISQFQGDFERALAHYSESLSAARQSGKRIYISQSLRGLGALSYMNYDLAEARKYINEALEISRSAGDDFGMAAALARLGDISNIEGDLSTACDLTSESLEIFRRIGYSEGVSAKLYNLGAIVFLQGDSKTAQQHFEEAHLAALELGEKINTRLIFDGFAALAAEQGHYARAGSLAGAADSIGTTIGYTIEPAEQKFRDAYLGKLRSELGEKEFAEAYEQGRRLSTEQATELAHSIAGARATNNQDRNLPPVGSATTGEKQNSVILSSWKTIVFVVIAAGLIAVLLYWYLLR